MSTHLPECFETWQIPRKCNICDALRACEQRVRNRVISEVEELIVQRHLLQFAGRAILL